MLMNIFVSLSQPSFLLANENNHALLFSLLDAMNAILEHQYTGMYPIELAASMCSPAARV